MSKNHRNLVLRSSALFLVVVGSIAATAGVAACEGRPAHRVVAEIRLGEGTIKAIVDDSRRRVVFQGDQGHPPLELQVETAPDYVETRAFLLGEEFAVIEDRLFETDDDEPAYHWAIYSTEAAKGILQSNARPELQRKEQGWSLSAVGSQGQASVFTLCDGRSLEVGAVDCRGSVKAIPPK